MALIITFLGKGGSGRTTMAIAAARKMAQLGCRVLLVGGDPSPAWDLQVGTNIDSSATEIVPNFHGVKLRSTRLLQESWEQVKELEAKYLRTPTLKNVYGEELGVLPGMDRALALNALREYDQSDRYDVIIYDGTSSLDTLRMLGIPETFSWYIRRFGQVFQESDVGKALAPFVQPVTSAVLNVTWTADQLASEPTREADDILEEGKAALANPKRVLSYLVTNDNPVALAKAKYLWGSAQQVGLTVGGVLFNGGQASEEIKEQFAPLSLTNLPQCPQNDWQPLVEAFPDLRNPQRVIAPVEVDVAARQVRVFLPSFDKKQVNLTQYGPEITIEAGDQRRNIDLPPQLQGKPVKGAKFQNGYLIILF